MRISLVTAALVLPLAVTSIGPSSSAPKEEPPGPPAWASSLSAADLDSLQTMADEDGISLNEAITRYGWQNDFAIAATALEEQFPDDFTYAAIESDSSASISFKSEVPLLASALLHDLSGVRVRLFPDYGLSAQEVEALIEEGHKNAQVAKKSADLVTTFDYDTKRLIVQVDNSSMASGSADEVSEALKRLTGDRIDVSVTVTGISSRSEANLYGGARIERGGQNTLWCTSAFSVKSGSTTGVLTAGHCDDTPFTVENTSGSTEYSMTHKKGHEGTWGEFRWFTTTQTEIDNFYTNFSVTAELSAISSPVQDQRLCRFGHKTGRSCAAYVQDLSFCETIGGKSLCRLVRMDRDTAEDGDSGGPWFSGGTAYGIHGGQIGTWLGTRDYFSRVMYVDEALGVYVLNT